MGSEAYQDEAHGVGIGMNFMVDAQLPRRLAQAITALGGDALHTLDMPAGNLTTDREITQLAMRENRVVVTKDSDFVDSFLLRGEPAKRLFITTGNIPNNDLLALLQANWPTLQSMLSQGDFVELIPMRFQGWIKARRILRGWQGAPREHIIEIRDRGATQPASQKTSDLVQI